MPLSTFDKDVNVIAKLDDEPNNTGGLSPAEFKARFDVAANIIKSWLNNTHIPELQKMSDSVDAFARIFGAVIALETTISNTDEAVPTSAAVLKLIAESGSGDMLRSVYDPDKDGVVDLATKARALAEAIQVTLSGGATASASFDGSNALNLAVTALDPEKLSSPAPVSKGGTGGTDKQSACNGIGALSRETGGEVSGPVSFNAPLAVNEKLVLSPYSYGTELPEAGQAGRVFFLLM